MSERYSAVCHRRHGWIAAPVTAYFQLSATGKSIELHEPNIDPSRFSRYPFGTRFNTTSIIATEVLDHA